MMWLLNQTFFFFLVLIFLSGVFSYAEVMFTGLSRAQMNRIKRDNPHVLTVWENTPNQILATLLLSNNAVNIAIGVVSTRLADRLEGYLSIGQTMAIVIVGLCSGITVLIFAEILPKIVARFQNDRMLRVIAPLVNSWNSVVSPVSNFTVKLANRILSLLPKRFQFSGFYDQNLFKILLKNTVLPTTSRKILNNVLDFSNSVVTQVMTPANKMFTITLESSLSQAIERVIRSGYSRIPVYSNAKKQIVGLIYSKDLLAARRNESLFVLEDLIRPIFKISAQAKLPDLFRQFRAGHYHLALVVSPHDPSSILGVITLHDALESLVGDIREEF